ncbi:transcriptional regulator BetI [Pseudovibrio exalbescens]|uniref:HTH-type transcriptional regulator BetI n=1 Tax=Pseudovibrio exalbescens TaxID=197461 RepID=A0A1U7JEH4_9HYPH|nr:transcriptional regulator BetI [Pseudovibrio exalbescens]OKL43143.1 transcriptional regulator BetI [Pseudovibrio exalbescens]
MKRAQTIEERKSSIIDATIFVIHDRGYSEATMAQIAKRAGVSTGLPHHYFGSKALLLNATMVKLLKDLSVQTRAQMKGLSHPEERVKAIVAASFSQEQFRPEVISAWLAFYVQARTEQATRRLLRIYHSRLISNLVHEFSGLAPRPEAIRSARSTAALIDGLWLQMALAGDNPSPSQAMEIALHHVDLTVKAEKALV